MVIEAAIF